MLFIINMISTPMFSGLHIGASPCYFSRRGRSFAAGPNRSRGGLMKDRTARFLAILTLVFVLAALGAAQTAPQPPPELYLMADIRVEVAKALEYETGLKDLIARLDKQGFPIRFDVYSTDDSRYYIIYGVEDFAGIDRWRSAWREFEARTGPAEFLALRRRMASAELERSFRFWYFRTDISYLPAKERLKPEEIGYYTWDYVWLVPGAEAEFEAINKEWIALSESSGVRDPFLTYAGELGADGPVYCWFEYGKSAADHSAAEERFWKALGEAGADLSRRTRALIRRLESKTGRYRPDLSYAPRR